jgi:hypothetical protein
VIGRREVVEHVVDRGDVEKSDESSGDWKKSSGGSSGMANEW